MFSGSTKPFFRLGLLVGLAISLAIFIPAGFGQGKTDTNTQYPHVDLDHPEALVGQEVTLVGDVEKIHSSSAFVMEAKDQDTKDHILVISVGSDAHPQGELKEGKPTTATGTIRTLDRAALERDYGPIDFGTTPFEKFDGKPVLIRGPLQTAQLQKEPERPTVTEPVAAAPEPAPTPAPAAQPAVPEQIASANTATELPRTATSLPAIGLVGLLSLLGGIGIQLFRQREN